MKRILIPTDFSDKAWNTILYAMELYRNVRCEFEIVNTYDISSTQLKAIISSQGVGHYYNAVKIESDQELKMVLEDINNSKPAVHHTFKTISKKGSLVTILEELTSQYQYDFISIGTKGVTAAKEVFLGSNTQKVIQNIHNCPILVVPEESYFENVSNIAFATDFKKIYHKAEIQPIRDLAKMCNATVRMIHIYDQPELNKVQQYNAVELEHYFKNISYDFHVIPDFSTVEEAVQEFIEELEIDLLVMINYPYSFIKRLLRESVIKKITFNTTIPFLIIPADT